MSNFRSQLAQAGLSHLFQKLLEECARVRNELGYPIMITPFAQLVGTQAVLNVVQGERYKRAGRGQEVCAGLLRQAARAGRSRRARPHRGERLAEDCAQTPAARAGGGTLRTQYPTASDDERILRFMFAGQQVDDMLAAGAMKTEYAFEAPLVRLVRQLAANKNVTRVYFSRSSTITV